MKICKEFRKLICFLICYMLILTALPVQVIAASNSNDTVINNGSLLVKEGDWLYYRNSSDGGSIYKIKADGTQNTKINDISSCDININGDWIYFKQLSTDYTKYYEMYRIKRDGSQLQDLNFKAYSEKLIGDSIYYSDLSSGFNRIKLDGTENKNLMDTWIDLNENVSGDYVYYNKYTQNGYKISRSNLDGSNETQVFTDIKNGRMIKATDNWIYIEQYDSSSKTYALYRLKPDGSEKQQVASKSANYISIINDDWIYDYQENCFKKMDGSKTINETDVIRSIPITIVGDWIYYHKTDGLYALKTDETQKLKLYNATTKYLYDYDFHLFSCINDGTYIYYINDYKRSEKFLYKFDINSGASQKLTPEEDIQKVSKDKQWTINFTKAFDPNTINDKNILVTDGDNCPVKISITPNADGKSITINKYKGTYSYDSTWMAERDTGGKQIYNIRITQDVKDKNGQPLKRYVVKKFELTD